MPSPPFSPPPQSRCTTAETPCSGGRRRRRQCSHSQTHSTERRNLRFVSQRKKPRYFLHKMFLCVFKEFHVESRCQRFRRRRRISDPRRGRHEEGEVPLGGGAGEEELQKRYLYKTFSGGNTVCCFFFKKKHISLQASWFGFAAEASFLPSGY